MDPCVNVWGVLRSFLYNNFHFGSIKAIVCHGGLDPSRMAHLEQVSGGGGLTKSQLLSAVDTQTGEFDEKRLHQFIQIVTTEALRQRPDLEQNLRGYFEKIGWTISDGIIVEKGELDSSHLDHLTGLLDRKTLDAQIVYLIDKTRGASQPLSAVFVDLDYFKKVNDQHGHDTGDAVLKSVGSIIKSIVEGKGQVYRYGGEEIVILLPNHSTQEAVAVAERARQQLETKPIHKIMVTASFGVACRPDHGDDASSLLKSADAALYDAKKLGRNLVRIYGEPAPKETTSAPRQPIRKTAQQSNLLQENQKYLRMRYFQGRPIKCPKDLTSLRIKEIATMGPGGIDLLVSCPLCGYTEVLAGSDE